MGTGATKRLPPSSLWPKFMWTTCPPPPPSPGPLSPAHRGLHPPPTLGTKIVSGARRACPFLRRRRFTFTSSLARCPVGWAHSFGKRQQTHGLATTAPLPPCLAAGGRERLGATGQGPQVRHVWPFCGPGHWHAAHVHPGTSVHHSLPSIAAAGSSKPTHAFCPPPPPPPHHHHHHPSSP